MLASAAWRRDRRSDRARTLRLARTLLTALGRISQEACGSCAALAFLRPPRSRRTRCEDRALASGARVRVAGPRGDVAVWVWGTGPRVLLVHGWGGHAARLGSFVAPLVQAGFGVVAFDAPAHGLSTGRFASLPDFVGAIELVARLTSPVGLIGHSMGAAACALALRGGLEARAAVLLSPPADPQNYTRRFARALRLSERATRSMNERLEARYGVRLPDLRLVGRGCAVPILVFHDERDARVPIRDGRAIVESWASAILVPTRGLGHHRILRDASVVSRAVAFLAEACGMPAGLRAASAS